MIDFLHKLYYRYTLMTGVYMLTAPEGAFVSCVYLLLVYLFCKYSIALAVQITL